MVDMTERLQHFLFLLFLPTITFGMMCIAPKPAQRTYDTLRSPTCCLTLLTCILIYAFVGDWFYQYDAEHPASNMRRGLYEDTALVPYAKRHPVRQKPTSCVTSAQGLDLHVIRVDGCQYLEAAQPGQNCYSLTHKGNCDNPIHKHAP